MVNVCKVIYKCEKGLMTFHKKKTVFLHRDTDWEVSEGLGVIIEDSIIDKNNYAFAKFKNISTVIPFVYNTLDFFNNKGIPFKIYKGIYGENVILKESYIDRNFIRAYSDEGDVLLYESEILITPTYNGENMYYKRIDTLMPEWEDITDEIYNNVLSDLLSKKCNVSIANDIVIQALKSLVNNKIYKLSNGVIIGEGNFESLAIWSDKSEIKMAWLGRKFDFDGIDKKDITEEIKANL